MEECKIKAGKINLDKRKERRKKKKNEKIIRWDEVNFKKGIRPIKTDKG